jgi:Zn-finger protein
MSYESWHKEHSAKHKTIVNKLSHLSDNEIITYFDFENMKIKEKDFCILYTKNKKCHDIENLNCYLCACPNFRIGKNSSSCDIDSKYGEIINGKDGFIHQDCSKCLVPHDIDYIKKNFDRDWSNIMKKSIGNIKV